MTLPALPAIMEGIYRSRSSSEKAGWAGIRMVVIGRPHSRKIVTTLGNRKAILVSLGYDNRFLIVYLPYLTELRTQREKRLTL